MDTTQAIARAIQCGAIKATVIPQDTIILSAHFRTICEGNGCGFFGKCWMCPPEVGDIYTVMDTVRRYRYGLLYQTIADIEDSFDIEGMEKASDRHAQVSQRIQREVAPMLGAHTLHLSCGGCHLCSRCAKRENKPCRHPDKALPSLESYGVDVYNTVKNTDLHYINGQNTVTFFGMVLFGEVGYV